MEKTLFDGLKQSLKEAKSIRIGEVSASRRFIVEPIDVKAVRDKTGLSENEFAQKTQISTRTL